jgi:hypothetical protein
MAAPGKSCGSCGLCCKLMGIAALDKPPGPWCSHFKRGVGCGVYADRPAECRSFECEWLRSEGLGPEWRPDKAKFLLVVENDGKRMNVVVDPAQSTAWTREPYHSRIRRMAQRSLDGYQLIVCIGDRRIVVFPDQEADLGVIGPEAKIVSGYAEHEGGLAPYAMVLKDVETPA